MARRTMSASKKVIVINQFALPKGEAGITRQIDLFSLLGDWRFKIVAGDRNHSTQERIVAAGPEFSLIRMPRWTGGSASRVFGWAAFCVGSFLKVLLDRDAGVVYASSPQPLSALTAYIAARLRRRAFVLEVRDLWPDSLVMAGRVSPKSVFYRILKCVEVFLVTRADAIVGVTRGWEKHFVELGADIKKIHVVPNGAKPADLTRYASRSAIRAENGFEGFVAMYAGAHGFANGLDLVLDAAEQLPDVSYVLIGDGPEKPRLIAKANERGLTNVRFLDPVPKDELVPLLWAADVGVHCLRGYIALNDGMSPNKIFDYMSVGLPVVSNAGAAARSLVGNGNGGLAVGEDELASGILQICRMSKGDRDRLGSQGRNMLESEYSIYAAARRLSQVLDEAIQ